jgi:hypothetical protein
MKEPGLNPPGKIPYRWFWVQGVVFLAIVNVPAGAMMVILGLVERRRGAPPI